MFIKKKLFWAQHKISGSPRADFDCLFCEKEHVDAVYAICLSTNNIQ